MKNYLELLQNVLSNGIDLADRTGTGTLNLFGAQLRFDLGAGFPLVTTKQVHFHSIKEELLWFLSGSTNIDPLCKTGVKIWNEWAAIDGDLGKIYGYQWRNFGGSDIVGGVDQIVQLIANIKTDPHSRRHIVTAWNPQDLEECALPPCHIMFQMFVMNGKLSCHVYQRSADMFLGVPFNIASYALLTHLIAAQCDLGVGDLIWSAGSVHLYKNHINEARMQLSRDPRSLPLLFINYRPDSIFHYEGRHIQLADYNPHPKIAAPVSV